MLCTAPALQDTEFLRRERCKCQWHGDISFLTQVSLLRCSPGVTHSLILGTALSTEPWADKTPEVEPSELRGQLLTPIQRRRRAGSVSCLGSEHPWMQWHRERAELAQGWMKDKAGHLPAANSKIKVPLQQPRRDLCLVFSNINTACVEQDLCAIWALPVAESIFKLETPHASDQGKTTNP